MSEIVRTLSSSDVTAARTTLQSMINRTTTSATRFNFVAAFDGTNNDRNNLRLSGTPQETNGKHGSGLVLTH